MDKEVIVQFILQNSEVSKDTLKEQVLLQGVTKTEFEAAWNDAKGVEKSATTATMDIETKLLWVFVAITIGGVLLNAGYGAFVSRSNPTWWINVVGYVSSFTDAVLGLHIAVRLLVIPASFYKSIGVAIFSYIMVLLMEALGLTVLFFSIGILLIIGMFILIMKIYDIGFSKTLLLMILQAIIIFLINLSVFGIYQVFRVVA